MAGLTFVERPVNGEPGLVARQGGTTVAVIAFEIADDRIRHIWSVRNPREAAPLASGSVSHLEAGLRRAHVRDRP